MIEERGFKDEAQGYHQSKDEAQSRDETRSYHQSKDDTQGNPQSKDETRGTRFLSTSKPDKDTKAVGDIETILIDNIHVPYAMGYVFAGPYHCWKNR